ncbi:restriction endonuclease subunit S [Klebsiella pneumoniae]|uniref:Type I restriction-modification system, specificity subunit S n=1 Tax=Klebsiella pneumoniae TaxID=573 RepID=A0A3Q8CI56_KLEPN|nr:restriction endonuclease subunit S [Klebsiella pneumoniae]AUG89375.1 Type I restriction-modification system, specificity subunit S [Klebsiella pneumoniae]ECI8717355.1 restriction endonuclease subunit S [Salmonella enterica subsp. enterica serovar Anatum]MBC4616707.1 restriction endonuclease subunit S [Klebsiella pneumoniae]QFY36918.1 restriction endonuclease subunit M [Klebsiella pneumoniae]
MSELSYLEKLLDGVEVEWLPLGEITKYEQPTKYLVKAKDYHDTYTTPVLTAGKTFILGYTNETYGIYQASKAPVIIFDDFTTANKWVDFDFKAKSSAMKMVTSCDDNKTLLKYVYYWLNTLPSEFAEGDHKRQWISNYSQKKIPIPCPDTPEKSLAIQSEIVRILDKFTALTAELTAELTARKKQYNYYRDQLLSFDEGEVEWKTLIDACDYVDYRGKTPRKTSEGIFLVTAKNIRMGFIDYTLSQEFISKSDYSIVMRRGTAKIGDILITTEAPCGFVAQVDNENIALAQRVIKYRSKDKNLSNSFLKHYLLGSQFQEKLMNTATGSTVKGIKGSKLHQLTVPIPSVNAQEKIVRILDKFDTLTNSINEGLPREIELRQKQYEYYRELLFSFPRSETASN